MSERELRNYLAEIYEAIKALRVAVFQTTSTAQAPRMLIFENPDLERRYAELFAALGQDEPARLFPALIAELDERIRHLRGAY
jgi:hypothetical protein